MNHIILNLALNICLPLCTKIHTWVWEQAHLQYTLCFIWRWLSYHLVLLGNLLSYKVQNVSNWIFFLSEAPFKDEKNCERSCLFTLRAMFTPQKGHLNLEIVWIWTVSPPPHTHPWVSWVQAVKPRVPPAMTYRSSLSALGQERGKKFH